MNHIIKTIENYLNALNASEYLLRLIHDNKEVFPPLKVTYTQSQFIKSVGYLRAMNKKGYHIYARPIGYEYVLLDDLTRDKLTSLAELKPCLLLETSPNNYQAWLKFSEPIMIREVSLSICRELAVLFNADLGSAEPDHVGRVPTFTNRKEKHRQSNGYFPFVKLHKYSDRYTTFNPSGGFCANSKARQKQPSVSNNSNSEIDFKTACDLLREGKEYDYIYDEILKQFDARKHKETDYIPRTIRNAAKAVNKSDNSISLNKFLQSFLQ